MLSVDEVLKEIASALAIPEISENDSSSTVSKWDSLGHLLIQIKLSELTGGKSDLIVGLSNAQTISEILVILQVNGLLKT